MGERKSILEILDQDCLQELFARCATSDLHNLALTCSTFNSIISKSETVWARRLWADHGLKIALSSLPSTPGTLRSFARSISLAPVNQHIRFQGVLVNGAIDGMNMWYWVDNLFKSDNSYFCSDASNNVDCLGLLLDGIVEREEQYRGVREFMERRCRYAAALFERIHHHASGGIESLLSIVEQWSDQHLEGFFLSLVSAIDENQNVFRRLLFYDTPADRIEIEERNCLAVSQYLRERFKTLKEGIMVVSGGARTMFDASCMNKLPVSYPQQAIGLIHEIKLGRVGSLTCPVSCGVLFVGIVNRTRFQGLDIKETMSLLQKATLGSHAIAITNDLDTFEAVEEHVAANRLPPIVEYSKTYPGTYCQFDVSWTEESYDSSWLLYPSASQRSSRPCISWRPLVWFRFHSREEASLIGSSPPQVQGDNSNETLENIARGHHEVVAGAVTEDLANHQPIEGVPGGHNIHIIDHETFYGESDEEEEEEEEAEEEEDNFGNIDFEANEDDGEADPFESDHTRGRNELLIKLCQPVAANAMMVKLINQENLMNELMDDHSYPNIDMTCAVAHGKQVMVPMNVLLLQ